MKKWLIVDIDTPSVRFYSRGKGVDPAKDNREMLQRKPYLYNQ